MCSWASPAEPKPTGGKRPQGHRGYPWVMCCPACAAVQPAGGTLPAGTTRQLSPFAARVLGYTGKG